VTQNTTVGTAVSHSQHSVCCECAHTGSHLLYVK